MTARVPASGAQEQRQALAADGKRIRGANRNGTIYETATLVEHRTGVPVASLTRTANWRRSGHCWRWFRSVARSPSMRCTPLATPPSASSSSMAPTMTVKGNCSETFEALGMPWEDAAGRFSEDPQKGHGRIDRRHIEVLTPLDKTLNPMRCSSAPT